MVTKHSTNVNLISDGTINLVCSCGWVQHFLPGVSAYDKIVQQAATEHKLAQLPPPGPTLSAREALQELRALQQDN